MKCAPTIPIDQAADNITNFITPIRPTATCSANVQVTAPTPGIAEWTEDEVLQLCLSILLY